MGAPAQAPAHYKTSYTEQITKAKVFKLPEYVVSMIFFRLRTWNLDFDLRWGLNSHQKQNMMHPPKIDQKDCFSNNKNLNFNFNSGNGFIDPRSASQDIKLVLKGYKLIIIWGKPLFLRPNSSSPPRNRILARTVSFFDRFLQERYQITQEDILLQIRHVPNVFETSPFLSPCIAHHY